MAPVRRSLFSLAVFNSVSQVVSLREPVLDAVVVDEAGAILEPSAPTATSGTALLQRSKVVDVDLKQKSAIQHAATKQSRQHEPTLQDGAAYPLGEGAFAASAVASYLHDAIENKQAVEQASADGNGTARHSSSASLLDATAAAAVAGVALSPATASAALQGAQNSSAASVQGKSGNAVKTAVQSKSSAKASALKRLVLHLKQEYSVYSLCSLAFAMLCFIGVLVWAARLLLPPDRLQAAFSALFIAGLYIAVSTSMIESNNWLMEEGNFPYPFTLTSLHMSMSFVLANCLRVVRPDFFPALQKVEVTPWYLLNFFKIGIPFAISLVCGNAAYQYVSVSFLQIMKQSNVALIYFMSCAAGLEELRRCNMMLLAVVILSGLAGVEGEVNFVWTGFLLQCASSFSEGLKVIIQSILMSGEQKLDPLTLVLFMAPACFIANILPMMYLEGAQLSTILPAFKAMWPFLLANAANAFALNCIVAQCIKQLSAIGYLMAGICKDITIIVSSTMLLGESLTLQQDFSFTMSLTGVAMYSLYKQNISCFQDDDLLVGFRKVFASFREEPKNVPAALDQRS